MGSIPSDRRTASEFYLQPGAHEAAALDQIMAGYPSIPREDAAQFARMAIALDQEVLRVVYGCRNREQVFADKAEAERLNVVAASIMRNALCAVADGFGLVAGPWRPRFLDASGWTRLQPWG